jgi:hypothetical protein
VFAHGEKVVPRSVFSGTITGKEPQKCIAYLKIYEEFAVKIPTFVIMLLIAFLAGLGLIFFVLFPSS